MISGCRLFVMTAVVIVLVACQGDGVVSGEKFEINESDAERAYCDTDDGQEATHELEGKIRVFDKDGSLQHEGEVNEFQLKATLTCTDSQTTSMALTPVGNEGQDGKVTYSYQDASDTEASATVSFDFVDEQAVQLEADAPEAHSDHRMLMWFGYDAAASWQARLVLHKREGLDGTLGNDFIVRALALRDVKFSDDTEEKYANFILSLSP